MIPGVISTQNGNLWAACLHANHNIINTHPKNKSHIDNNVKSSHACRVAGSSATNLAQTCMSGFVRSAGRLAPNPMLALAIRLLMSCSRPAKAPPQMKRMLVVSTWMKSDLGFLRPPSLGTFTMAPWWANEAGREHAKGQGRGGGGGVRQHSCREFQGRAGSIHPFFTSLPQTLST